MIIDFTKNAVSLPDNTMLRDWARKPGAGAPDSWWKSEDDPFKFDWEAHSEWKEYRDKRMGSTPNSRKIAIEVIEEALYDTHMRNILRRACCKEIYSEVNFVIDSWNTKRAAARIVDLDCKIQEARFGSSLK